MSDYHAKGLLYMEIYYIRVLELALVKLVLSILIHDFLFHTHVVRFGLFRLTPNICKCY